MFKLITAIIFLLFNSINLYSNNINNELNSTNLPDSIYDESKYIPLEYYRDIFIKKNSDLIVKKITILGLTKTEETIIFQDINIEEGDNISSFLPTQTKSNIEKRGIFEEIDISYKKISATEAEIIITLKEKITLIPIPFISSNDGSTKVGFFFIETNFLNKNKNLIVGGSYSSTSKGASIIYADNSLLDTNFTLVLALRYSDNINEYKSFKGDLRSQYKAQDFGSLIRLGYKIDNINSINTMFHYYNTNIDEQYNEKYNSPIDTTIYTNGIGYNIDNTEIRNNLSYGFSSNILLRNHIIIDDLQTDNKQSGNFSINYSKNFISFKDKFSIHAVGYKTNAGVLLQEALGGSKGFYSIDSGSILFKNATSITFAEEYPIYTNNIAFFTTEGFIEAGMLNNDFDTDLYHFTGVGASFNIYLKKISIPALKFVATHNFKDGNNRFSFSLGMPA